MTTPAWITDRLPRHSDADPEQLVIVSTHLDPDCWNFMHWSRAAQGNLPWRHTSRWVDHKPEPPAPVIVTPEVEPRPEPKPEKATRGFARIIWHFENQEQIAIATDGTAWRRFVVCGEWDNWEQVHPLPQPGEE